jgi:hypothetical protein
VMHGRAGYKEHGFALYGQGKRIFNSSNHCILNVLAEETDGRGTAANRFVESIYMRGIQISVLYKITNRICMVGV